MDRSFDRLKEHVDFFGTRDEVSLASVLEAYLHGSPSLTAGFSVQGLTLDDSGQEYLCD